MASATDRAGTTRVDIRLVIISSIVGTTVEWYDFFLYGTAAGIVFGKSYFPSGDPANAARLRHLRARLRLQADRRSALRAHRRPRRP